MFKQLFASMNDALEDIISQIPLVTGAKRKELEDRLSVLKAMSDTCIEEWLLFEEKMGKLLGESPDEITPVPPKPEKLPAVAAAEPMKELERGSFDKGQGYYKLSMFKDAVAEFEQVVRKQPDFLLARVFLAMAYFRSGDHADAYRQFQFLVPLTEDRKMKAISYNAMGCIQAENQNMEKALEYFRLAHSADPASIDPVLNIKHWDKRC